ncbi:hypothetical protein POM88_036182 [Heracleum sosnowskyi]|uniref:Uncharacterized protein n=1 Tax=Heracleum sosnowskyi TaxID=360622 RepID=A0AAD8HQ11_9APIA|nr:hypothetical protein POM88_036182 [Heracleum sosnowskyi]
MGIDSLKSGLPFSREARYMNTNGSEVYALLSNKYSSFSMYEGKQGENFVTYEASSKVCGTEKVKKFIAGGLDDNQLHSEEKLEIAIHLPKLKASLFSLVSQSKYLEFMSPLT